MGEAMSSKLYKYVLDFDIKYRRNEEWGIRKNVTLILDIPIVHELRGNLTKFVSTSLTSMYYVLPFITRINMYKYLAVGDELKKALLSNFIKFLETGDEKYLYNCFSIFSTVIVLSFNLGLLEPEKAVKLLKAREYSQLTDKVLFKMFDNTLISFVLDKVDGKPLSDEAIDFIITMSSLMSRIFYVEVFDEYKVKMDVYCVDETIQELINYGEKLGLEIKVKELFTECDKLGEIIDLIQDMSEVEVILKDSKGTLLVVSKHPEKTKTNILKLFERLKYKPPINIMGKW